VSNWNHLRYPQLIRVLGAGGSRPGRTRPASASLRHSGAGNSSVVSVDDEASPASPTDVFGNVLSGVGRIEAGIQHAFPVVTVWPVSNSSMVQNSCLSKLNVVSAITDELALSCSCHAIKVSVHS